MGGGGKGGSTDTGPMLEYGNKALGLQKEIYDQQRSDAQPWYQAGTSAVNQLSTLLGLNGQGSNNSASNRQSLLDQYKGQFTTQNQSTGGNMYRTKDGRLVTAPEAIAVRAPHRAGQYKDDFRLTDEMVKDWGLSRYQEGPTSTTDTTALNSYVDNLLAQQGQENESNPLFGSLAKAFGQDDFQTDPGYQFRLGEGTKALERKLNAAGKTYSPEAAKALMSYGQGLASEEYGNAYNRFNIDQDNLFNRLASISGFGQNASGQIANAGANYANAGNELYTGMGNSITASNIAKAQQGSSMFNTLLGAGAQLGGAYFMSDRRLKENIEEVGEENGHKLYKFNYINVPEKTFIGVLAQEVLEKAPEAVFESEGFMGVNYDMIGVRMREVVTCH